MPTTGLTEMQEQNVIQLLSQIPDNSPISSPLFYAVARLFPTPAPEVIIYRHDADSGQIEILLHQRPPEDPFFAGQWVTPGTSLQGKDVPLERAYERICKKAGVSRFAAAPKLVANFTINGPRGPEVHMMYWAEINEEPKLAQFFPVHNLPAPLVFCVEKFIAVTYPAYAQVVLV